MYRKLNNIALCPGNDSAAGLENCLEKFSPCILMRASAARAGLLSAWRFRKSEIYWLRISCHSSSRILWLWTNTKHKFFGIAIFRIFVWRCSKPRGGSVKKQNANESYGVYNDTPGKYFTVFLCEFSFLLLNVFAYSSLILRIQHRIGQILKWSV